MTREVQWLVAGRGERVKEGRVEDQLLSAVRLRCSRGLVGPARPVKDGLGFARITSSQSITSKAPVALAFIFFSSVFMFVASSVRKV